MREFLLAAAISGFILGIALFVSWAASPPVGSRMPEVGLGEASRHPCGRPRADGHCHRTDARHLVVV